MGYFFCNGNDWYNNDNGRCYPNIGITYAVDTTFTVENYEVFQVIKK